MIKDLNTLLKTYFAEGWSTNESDDTALGYYHTGYIIKYKIYPIIWASKLQSEIFLSTTEAEYIALSQATGRSYQ